MWVYYVCVVAALWGTLQSYPEIYARVTHGFCTAIWPEWQPSLRGFRLGIAAYVFAMAVPLVWIDVSFATLTAIVAFLATNAGVALAMLAALYLDRQLPPLYRTQWWLFAAGVVSAVMLVAASCVSGWGLAAKHRHAVGSTLQYSIGVAPGGGVPLPAQTSSAPARGRTPRESASPALAGPHRVPRRKAA